MQNKICNDDTLTIKLSNKKRRNQRYDANGKCTY